MPMRSATSRARPRTSIGAPPLRGPAPSSTTVTLNPCFVSQCASVSPAMLAPEISTLVSFAVWCCVFAVCIDDPLFICPHQCFELFKTSVYLINPVEIWVFVGLQVGCDDDPHEGSSQRSHGLIAGLLMGTLGDECCQKLNVADKLVAVANLQLWGSQNDGMTLLFVAGLRIRFVREDGAHRRP